MSLWGRLQSVAGYLLGQYIVQVRLVAARLMEQIQLPVNPSCQQESVCLPRMQRSPLLDKSSR